MLKVCEFSLNLYSIFVHVFCTKLQLVHSIYTVRNQEDWTDNKISGDTKQYKH